jgi:hypothetical protein
MPKTRSKMGSLSRSQHAEVAWCTEDIQELRPDWSAKRCFAFLMDNEDEIQCRMIEEGWEAIKDLLPREG